MRSAFGFGGQKCSANSRVYVRARGLRRLRRASSKSKTEAIKVGDPLERDVYLGPVINDAAVETFERAVEAARKNGTVVTGGERMTEGELREGHVRASRRSSRCRGPLDLARRSCSCRSSLWPRSTRSTRASGWRTTREYGLTAGFYSEDRAEIDEWLDRIEAGVVYVNRRAGATTGAWPGVQPFGGWKGSGTTGKAGGGPYYVTQYMREQSRTVISE